ncbi:MAG: metalloprotease RseP [Verrucomicrobiota bacterium]|jgi:regulator of sigma E protease
MDTLKQLLLILTVIVSFNIMIFVHELGHFLAARWRGLKVEKFQIWFGKPLWSKNIAGVQYGLGWIPAGGFVALPQMAPMQSLEGSTESTEPLPPISPLDKIIVAIAGPVFSLGLAMVLGLGVWAIGKPQDRINTTQVGFIKQDSPAQKAGFALGDQILAVNGKPVAGFMGGLDCVTENIVLSEGDVIEFTVLRQGETQPRIISSQFETEKTAWYQRRGMRQVGIASINPAIVGMLMPHSPAEKAGLQVGDEIIALDGNKIWSTPQISQYLETRRHAATIATVKRGEQTIEMPLQPVAPLTPANQKPMLGIVWDAEGVIDSHIIHPSPWKQCKDSVKMMLATFTALFSPRSSIGVDQLSGPISIAKAKFDLLNTDENGWLRLLSFMVLINVNLAIFNMLPFPVLDGGHTTLAIMEWISRRPVRARVLEYVQTACALALISLFLYITSKDIGGFVKPKEKNEPIRFAP